MLKSKYARLNVLAYVPLWFNHLCEKGGGGWLRFKKICESADEVKITYHLVNFKLGIQPALISGVLLMFLSMATALIQGFKTIKKNNVHLILSPVETPQSIILAYISSKITHRSYGFFLNSVPLFGLVGFSEFQNVNPKFSYKRIFEVLRTNGLSSALALVEAFIWYIAFRMLRSPSTRIICLNAAIADDLSNLDIKEQVLKIYPGNGINFNEVQSVKPTIGDNKYEAIYAAGNFHPEKGIFEVVKIWETVVKAKPDAQLAIAGRIHHSYPSVINELTHLIEILDLKKNVIILNDLSKGITQKELWMEMKRSKFFLYPSRKDVWPLVIGEALACGLPILAYDLLGIRNAYGVCPAVYLRHVGDVKGVAKIAMEILDDGHLLGELFAKAQQYAESHSWNNVAELERKAYQTIIDC